MITDSFQSREALEQQIMFMRQSLQAANSKIWALELQVAIREWAIAGVLSRSLHLNMAIQPDMLAQANNLMTVGESMGRQAARTFIHDAELAFKEHATYAQLQCDNAIKPAQHHSTWNEFEKPDKKHWPKP